MPIHPISIGPISLSNPVLLAPMSGVTDAPFRRLAPMSAAAAPRTCQELGCIKH
jgi:tRNA-dihydrouridine synthase